MRLTRQVLTSVALALLGLIVLLAPLCWLLWQETVMVEDRRVAELAQSLGRHTESLIVDAIEQLDTLNHQTHVPCSPAHQQAMHDAAIGQPHIKAIGYWRATERLCGAGFVQRMALKPPRADRIYDNGVIAWWPGEQTRQGGLELFLIRYGEHDVAIDPNILLDPGPLQSRQASLWVEGLEMAVKPLQASLPPPTELPQGLLVDTEGGRLVSRFSTGTVFPIDIVVAEPLERFWARYSQTLLMTAAIGGVLLLAWIALVLRYSRRRFSLSGELRDAIARGQLTVVYQPVVELDSGRWIGAEALVRWKRQNGDVIGPDVFIPVAEEAGLVPEITRVVLDATLKDLGPLLRAPDGLSVNLNLSAADLEDPAFEQHLRNRLRAAGVPSSTIKLEITERSLVNSDLVRHLIKRLRDDGHAIAIDDFGTGYSSLSYLESFDIDVLKIDKSFVDAIEKEAVTSHVVGHVIEMAQSLKLEIVAEGIEGGYQVDWLRSRGVHHGQGFYFSAPLTGTDFLANCDARSVRPKLVHLATRRA